MDSKLTEMCHLDASGCVMDTVAVETNMLPW